MFLQVYNGKSQTMYISDATAQMGEKRAWLSIKKGKRKDKYVLWERRLNLWISAHIVTCLYFYIYACIGLWLMQQLRRLKQLFKLCFNMLCEPCEWFIFFTKLYTNMRAASPYKARLDVIEKPTYNFRHFQQFAVYCVICELYKHFNIIRAFI